MDDRDVEDVELAERLEAYAEARLSPSLSATSRMRTQVMAAAARRAALMRADADRAALAAADLASRPRLVRVPRWRRPAMALLAASLTLALAVGSVAAARPGGPLYGTRIWAETLTLPSTAADRAAAEVRRLNDRLAEAAEAAAAGDANAADAALAAYNAILAESMAGTNGNAVANATLDAAVRQNIEVLTALLGRATFPDQARDAIQHAIDQSDFGRQRAAGQARRWRTAVIEPRERPGHERIGQTRLRTRTSPRRHRASRRRRMTRPRSRLTRRRCPTRRPSPSQPPSREPPRRLPNTRPGQAAGRRILQATGNQRR